MILDETFPAGHLVLQIFLQPIVCVGFLRVSYSAKGSSACATAKKGPVLKAVYELVLGIVIASMHTVTNTS